jgi:uncharacterized lipoprotein YddW (UPF0748 family)
MKNKFILLCLALLLVLSGKTISYAQETTGADTQVQYASKSSTKINAINPTPETNPLGGYYPGFRGNNQLVIYTPEYGEYTGTNEYGKEAIVIEDKVFGFCGSNCYIPKNGFIVSGHGSAKKWINEKLMEGATVKIYPNTMTMESIITPESYAYKAGQRITEAKKLISEYKRTLPGYQSKISENYLRQATQKYNEARYALDKFQYEEGKDLSDLALKMAEMSFYYAIPAVKNELHGVWLRPIEKNSVEIAKTLDRLKKSGIDNVFLESYYQGYTIFPSTTMESYGIKGQRPEFIGWNPLQVWIEEAHKRDMKIQIWFQTFYAGSETPRSKHILDVYPEWANVQRKNFSSSRPRPSISEHNGYFLDPANPNVQKFLTQLLTEIVTCYNVDGLNIDYIRYPKSLTPNISQYLDSTWGYSAYARSEFKSLYGKDPIELTVNDPLMQRWNQYRQDKVTTFVANLRSITGEKNIMISAVIFPGQKDTVITKLQNWSYWAQNSYIDAFTPLIMSSDSAMAATSVREIRTLSNGNVAVLAGLFEPFTAGSPADLLSQIASVRREGSSGIILFDNAHLGDDFITALSARILRKD